MTAKPEFVGRAADNYDALFIDELSSPGLSELQLRARCTEYVQRFVQLAAKYEEDSFGATALSYPSAGFSEGQGLLGSGVIVEDGKELAMSMGRIDGWRRSPSYEMYKAVSFVTLIYHSHPVVLALDGLQLTVHGCFPSGLSNPYRGMLYSRC